MAQEVKNLKELDRAMSADVYRISKAILGKLADHVKTEVVDDYTKRVQRDHYPVRNPINKEEIESMPPKEIARFVLKTVMPERAIIYIRPGTQANRSGRIQELYGGKPWQKIRTKMQNLDYVNQMLSSKGLGGVKAKPTV